MRLIAIKPSLKFALIDFQFLDKIIIPENIAIRLANNTEVSAEDFYTNLITNIHKMRTEARRAHPKDQPKMNRNDFNIYLLNKGEEMQNDEQKIRKKMNKKKKFTDDEDFNIDMESSGERVTTNFPIQTMSDSSNDLNDTTIIFDQE